MATWGGRVGPYPSIRTGNEVAELDMRALGDNLVALGRGLATAMLRGARSVVVSGAAITSGTTVPAGAILAWVDSYPIYRVWTSAKAITFEATSGTLDLYLVVGRRTDADAVGETAMVGLALDDVTFTARTSGSAAPAWSVLMGSGSVTASSFTSFTAATGLRTVMEHASTHQHGGSDEVGTATPAANAIPKANASGRLDGWVTDATTSAKGKVQLAADGGTTAGTVVQANDARMSNARTPTPHAASHANGAADEISVAGLSGELADPQPPKTHAASHAYGQPDVITPASIHAVAGPGAVTDGKLMLFDGVTGYLAKASSLSPADLALLASDNTLTGNLTLTNGRQVIARDSKYGPPTSGTYVVNAWWMDRSGARWLCYSAGTPGTWLQLTPGYCDVWSGGGSPDITTAANWNGGALINGYRVFDSSAGEQQLYTYASGVGWLGAEFPLTMQPSFGLTGFSFTATTANVLVLPLPDACDLVVSRMNAVFATGTVDTSNKWNLALYIRGGTLLGVVTKDTTTIELSVATTTTVLSSATHGYLFATVGKVGSPAAASIPSVTLTCRYVRR